MLVKRVPIFHFAWQKRDNLGGGTAWGKEVKESPGHVWEALACLWGWHAGCFMPCVLFSQPIILLPQFLQQTRGHRCSLCTVCLPALCMSCFLPSFSAYNTPKLILSWKSQGSLHLWNFPPPRRSEPVGKHSPLRLREAISSLILHTSSKFLTEASPTAHCMG